MFANQHKHLALIHLLRMPSLKSCHLGFYLCDVSIFQFNDFFNKCLLLHIFMVCSAILHGSHSVNISFGKLDAKKLLLHQAFRLVQLFTILHQKVALKRDTSLKPGEPLPFRLENMEVPDGIPVQDWPNCGLGLQWLSG